MFSIQFYFSNGLLKYLGLGVYLFHVLFIKYFYCISGVDLCVWDMVVKQTNKTKQKKNRQNRLGAYILMKGEKITKNIIVKLYNTFESHQMLGKIRT